MTFNPCDDCGSGTSWSGIVWLVLVWLVPTVLFALRRQLREKPVFGVLIAVQWLSILAAVAVTLSLESGMAPESGLATVVPWLVGTEIALCCLALLVVFHSRRPGDHCLIGHAAWAAALLTLEVGCLSEVRLVNREGQVPLPGAVKCIVVEVAASSPGRAKLQDDLMRQIRAVMPGTEVIEGLAGGDILVRYEQDDMILCVDCGDMNGTRGQYWWWFLSVSRREFDPMCGADVTRTVATIWGENHKLGQRPARSAARQLRKLLAGRAA